MVLSRAIVRVCQLFRSLQYGLHKDQTPCFTSENLIEKNEALRGAKDEFASLKFLKRERFVYRFAFWVTTCRSPGLCKVPTDGGPRRKCVINQRILLDVRAVTVARARTFYDLTTVAHKERCHFLARRSFRPPNDPRLWILRSSRAKKRQRLK